MSRIADIDTPAVLVDLDIAEANIDRFQAPCDEHGLTNRPPVKTHTLPSLARRQLAAGAVGITCQQIPEGTATVAEGGVHSEERRGGEEGVGACRFGWVP